MIGDDSEFYNIFVDKKGDVIAAKRTAVIPQLGGNVMVGSDLFRVASPPHIFRAALMSGHVAVIKLTPIKGEA